MNRREIMDVLEEAMKIGKSVISKGNVATYIPEKEFDKDIHPAFLEEVEKWLKDSGFITMVEPKIIINNDL